MPTRCAPTSGQMRKVNESDDSPLDFGGFPDPSHGLCSIDLSHKFELLESVDCLGNIQQHFVCTAVMNLGDQVMRFEAKLANDIPQDEKRRSEFVRCVLHFPTPLQSVFRLFSV